MENIETKVVETKKIIHKFYCDKCNKYLGKSEELSDGYYTEFGDYKVKIYIPENKHGWYISKGCLCDKCKNQYFDSLADVLAQNGFKNISRL